MIEPEWQLYAFQRALEQEGRGNGMALRLLEASQL